MVAFIRAGDVVILYARVISTINKQSPSQKMKGFFLSHQK